MHACPNRMDPITTHVIPEEIEKIEIIKGPYTVRYGATFGGIVNMVTQIPDASDYGLHGSVHAGYESNGASLVSMARLQQATKTYDIVGNVGFRDFGDYEDGDGNEVSIFIPKFGLWTKKQAITSARTNVYRHIGGNLLVGTFCMQDYPWTPSWTIVAYSQLIIN